MRPGTLKASVAITIAAALAFSILGTPPAQGQDSPGLLGRLFRFGSNSASSGSSSSGIRVESARPPRGGHDFPESTGSTPPAILPPGTSSGGTLPPPTSSLPTAEPMPAPAGAATGNLPRLVPQPRVSHAVTDADPLVTRIQLGRSTEGSQFGMFLQVFADGTVIDSEGVHHVGRDVMKPVLDVVEAGEIFRVKGHCGAPPTDFIEQVQVVVYERRLGGLRANAFSFTGNPQNCDHSVRRLQAALDTLQTRISRTIPAATAPVTPPATSTATAEFGPALASPPPVAPPPPIAPPLNADAGQPPLAPPIQLDHEPPPTPGPSPR